MKTEMTYLHHSLPQVVMNTMGDKRAGFKCRVQQVFIGKGPQKEAGSWVQGQAEGHTQGVQKGNRTGREKAINVVWEIRQ
jgi:hypothetical protein